MLCCTILRFNEVEEVIGITGNPLAHRVPANYETLAEALLRFKNGKTASFTGLITDTVLFNQPYFRIFGKEVSEAFQQPVL
jgi:hypothetical protein